MSVAVITRLRIVGRWQPDARGRLQRAALELYAERGFEETTVADIAERAGVTERTFFRHFADKREVLFDGSNELQRRVVAAVEAAPASLPPLAVIGAAMVSVGPMLDERRPYSQTRSRVIASNASLQERELLKMSALSVAVADALRGRGVAEPAASLMADTGVTVFKVGFERWVRDAEAPELAACIQDALDELRELTRGGAER